MDLSPTGDARPYPVAPPLTVAVAREVVAQQRPRPDQRHLPPQDVDQLRQLVHAPAPQQPSQPRQPLFVRKRDSTWIARIPHRPQFKDLKRTFIQPRASLPKDHGPPHAPPDQQGRRPQNRRRRRQQGCGRNDVDRALGCTFPTRPPGSLQKPFRQRRLPFPQVCRPEVSLHSSARRNAHPFPQRSVR